MLIGAAHRRRQSHRWGTEEVETERRVLDAFRAVHFFEQGHRPNMQAMPAAYLQQRRSLVHTAVQMADTLELPVGGVVSLGPRRPTLSCSASLCGCCALTC